MKYNSKEIETIFYAIAKAINPHSVLNANTVACIHSFGINYCLEFKWIGLLHEATDIIATIPGVGEVRVTESLIEEIENKLSTDQIEAISEAVLIRIYPQLTKIIKRDDYKCMAKLNAKDQIEK